MDIYKCVTRADLEENMRKFWLFIGSIWWPISKEIHWCLYEQAKTDEEKERHLKEYHRASYALEACLAERDGRNPDMWYLRASELHREIKDRL